MEIENMSDRSALCQKLNFKLITRPGSLELIERGVLQVESNLKDMIESGEILFRRVSSDEAENFGSLELNGETDLTIDSSLKDIDSDEVVFRKISSDESDNLGSSPSMKILKHQEALDEVTARRLSLAAQQQCQSNANQEQKLTQISEQEIHFQRTGNTKTINPTSGSQQRSLITGQVSRFKGLVFHNYCPVGSKENQEIRVQQQEKYIQLQESRNAAKANIFHSKPTVPDKINYPNKCPRCSQTPDRINSLNDLTVAQLKTECRLRGLTRSGNKSFLINTLTPFKEEILAIENACTHVSPHQPFTMNPNSNSKLNLNDRSISLPTECYENMDHEPANHIVTPLTFNVTCIGGSISNLAFGSNTILISDNQQSDSQKINILDNFNNTKCSTDDPKESHETGNVASNDELQHQMVINSSSVCYPSLMESNSQNNTTLFQQPVNPLLFYKLPTPSGHDPAFIQTTGLEMIQLVQQELLRNIECHSQKSLENEPEVNQSTLQHQRYVLVNFLQQLIQKTPGFHNCQQLINDQHKINQWISNCPQFDFQNISQSQECMDHANTSSAQPFLVYLNQQQFNNPSTSDQVYEQYGENDLFNLINEVVAEDELKASAANVHKESHAHCLARQHEVKSPNSPMQTDAHSSNASKSVSKSNSDEASRGSDVKRAAWIQKVSPRLYKATSNSATSELSFSAFNFDFSGGSLLSACGSHTSSEGCGSINSSITDAQILSPGTEKVLFETIFQHTNSGSSMENDIFSSTMNMEDVSNG